MERHEILEAMSELKLYGMRASFDEIAGKGLARRDEVYPLIASLIRAERTHRQARSISYRIGEEPSSRSSKISTPSPSPIRRSMKGKFANSPPAPSSTPSAMRSSSAGPSPLHDAHLSMSLKFKSFLQSIAGRRTSQTTGCRRAFHVASVQVGGADDPGRSLTELIRRELTIFDQTAHGRRTNG